MDATTTTPIPHPDPPITPAEDALTPIVHIGTAPTRTLSGGRMHLSGGQATAPQRHDTTETILAILSGHLAILTGNHMLAFHPHTRDMIYIPATLPYALVNLSHNASVLALVFRTNPGFSTDIHRMPELDQAARARIDPLRTGHLDELMSQRAARARRG